MTIVGTTQTFTCVKVKCRNKSYCQTIQSYGKSEHMNNLAKLVSSKTRAEFFRLLFGVNSQPIHLRQIQRSSGLSIGSIQQEAITLQELGLITARKDGNRIYYEANKKHPLFHDIHRITLKTVGLVDVIRQALKTDAIACAFVFGSIARGEETADSDIDLMVIGDIGLRRLTSLLGGVANKLGREINPHVHSLKEFKQRLARKEHLVSRIMASPKIFIVGSEDDVKAMGE